jgi:hypothetical protein
MQHLHQQHPAMAVPVLASSRTLPATAPTLMTSSSMQRMPRTQTLPGLQQ